MDIKLWYSKDLKQWRWTLLNDKMRKHESGQQYDLRDAMNEIVTTVEHMVDEHEYEGEIEDNGRRTAGGRTLDR